MTRSALPALSTEPRDHDAYASIAQAYADDGGAGAPTARKLVFGHVWPILDALQRGRLYCNPGKCTLITTCLVWVGRLLRRGTVSLDPEQVDALAAAVAPRSLAELATFIGLIGWLAEHLRLPGIVPRPLGRLTEETGAWEWRRELVVGAWRARLGDLADRLGVEAGRDGHDEAGPRRRFPRSTRARLRRARQQPARGIVSGPGGGAAASGPPTWARGGVVSGGVVSGSTGLCWLLSSV
jgi:hypothetical protein